MHHTERREIWRERKKNIEAIHKLVAFNGIDWSRILSHRYNLFVICLTILYIFFLHEICRKRLWTMNSIESYLLGAVCIFCFFYLSNLFFCLTSFILAFIIAIRIWSRHIHRLMSIATDYTKYRSRRINSPTMKEREREKRRRKESTLVWCFVQFIFHVL